MRKMVWMRHPNLMDREPREVPESAMRFHINAGWELVPEGEEPKPGVEPTEGEQADQSQEQSEERRGGTSRTSRRAKAEDKKEASE